MTDNTIEISPPFSVALPPHVAPAVLPPRPRIESSTTVVGWLKALDRDQTGATPTAISANYMRLRRANLSEASHATLYRLAERRTNWRGRGSRSLQSASLTGFLVFWTQVCSQATEPEFVLAPNGNLIAEWHKSVRRHLDIEFVDTDTAYFGYFNGKRLLEGVESLQSIIGILNSLGSNALQWSEA
jgi:hypothetical protein